MPKVINRGFVISPALVSASALILGVCILALFYLRILSLEGAYLLRLGTFTLAGEMTNQPSQTLLVV
jgi:hypothetical protein